MYWILREHRQVRERRRLARHRSRQRPELVADAPRQVYSWDITKLTGPVKGVYYDAYVMIDIYSRYIVPDRPRLPPELPFIEAWGTSLSWAKLAVAGHRRSWRCGSHGGTAGPPLL
jgi:putative transposase